MARLAWLASALALGLSASNAVAADWGPRPSPKDSPGTGFKHDDGGALIVMCNTQRKLIPIGIREPRATWHKGDSMPVQPRADDGTQMQPSTGVVIGPTEIIIGEESTWDLFVMGKGTFFFFATGVGRYARIWPVSNFNEATTPVLQACGDHW